jgi:hypothetical protein
MSETVNKPKKARKPYVWTPQRKEAFERMRKKREDILTIKKDTKAKGKQDSEEEKKNLNELLKNTAKIKQILALIDGKNPPVVETPKEVKTDPKPKKKVVYKPPVEPESEEEEEEEESEAEEVVMPVVKIPPSMLNRPQPKSTFRYSTATAKTNLPKPPTENHVTQKPVQPEVKKPTFLFL